MRVVQLTLASALALFVVGCKKYDEGPLFSLKSKKARLTGEWELKKETYNGEEVASIRTETESQSELCFENDNHIVISFEYERKWEEGLKWSVNKDNSMDILLVSMREDLDYFEVVDCKNQIVNTVVKENDYSQVLRRSWEFSEDKTALVITNKEREEDIVEYRILRLTDDELYVELLEDGPVRKYEFKKQ